MAGGSIFSILAFFRATKAKQRRSVNVDTTRLNSKRINERWLPDTDHYMYVRNAQEYESKKQRAQSVPIIRWVIAIMFVWTYRHTYSNFISNVFVNKIIVPKLWINGRFAD